MSYTAEQAAELVKRLIRKDAFNGTDYIRLAPDHIAKLINAALSQNATMGEPVAEAEFQRPLSGDAFRWQHVHSVDQMQRFFMSRLPAIRDAARACGYAIGLHGSTRRDFDLIAVPWIDDHFTADELAAAIQLAACGLEAKQYEWEQKPNGRIAVSMPICWPEWEGRHGIKGLGMIDLSVMPSSEALAAAVKQRAKEIVQDYLRLSNYEWSCKYTGADGTLQSMPIAIDAIPTNQSALDAITRPLEEKIRQLDNSETQLIRERDNAEEWADKLASAIGEYFGVDIGEHSNLENPWSEALTAIESPQQQPQQDEGESHAPK